MVMAWLEGGQAELRGACAPPPPPNTPNRPNWTLPSIYPFNECSHCKDQWGGGGTRSRTVLSGGSPGSSCEKLPWPLEKCCCTSALSQKTPGTALQHLDTAVCTALWV